MNTLLFILMLFIAGLLFLYVVKPTPKHTPKHTPIKNKTSYEPRWERRDPHGVWMGDKFFHALNPFVPGNPYWPDKNLHGYDTYFEVDTKAYDIEKDVSSIEVTLCDRQIHVDVEQHVSSIDLTLPGCCIHVDAFGVRGSEEPHTRVEYVVELDEGRGWEVVAKLIEHLAEKQNPTLHF